MISRQEIESKINNMGDYVKIDYLARVLEEKLDFDTKKFVLVRLAGIYEERKMYFEAAKHMRNAADINTTYQGKINDFMKSAELFIKSGIFDEADISFNKANACANEVEKIGIKIAKKESYRTQAKLYIEKNRRSNAVKAYEKLLLLELDPFEKKEVQETLLNLYSKLGKIREYYELKKSI